MQTPDREALNGFAVDLGGTKIAAARIERGALTHRLQIATDGSAGPEAQVKAMAGLLRELGHHRGDPLGVAVAGRVTRDGSWHAVNRGTLEGISAFPLRDALRQSLGAATCCNDAAAAGLAEALFGAGRGCRNFAYLTVSTGIGGGIVLDGRLLESESGLAGHVGFVSSRHADARCGSGRFATAESVAAGRAIAAAAAACGHPGADARAVFAAAGSKDGGANDGGANDGGANEGGERAAWAERLVDRSARALATLLADLVTVLGLDGAAIGGSIGLAPGYLDRVRAALADEPELFSVPITPAALGPDSALVGALALQALEAGR